jgi:phosphonate transport system ATP-binding protein
MRADEPIASLDPRNAQVVMDALRRINREDGLTVLCNLHHLDTARAYCDRIIALQAGRLMFDGTPSDLTAERVREIYGVTEDEFHEDLAPKGSLVAA